MINEIKNYLIEACNKNDYNYWDNHIKFVVEIANKLALDVGADVEIVIISALLHDIAKVLDIHEGESHNIDGANFAVKFLKDKNYDIDKIEKVRKCILYHGGEIDNKINLTLEEWCVRNADILSLFNNITIFYYIAFNEMKLDYAAGRREVKKMIFNKYNRLDIKLKKEYDYLFETIYNSI